MCKAYNIPVMTFLNRIKNGFSLQDSLTIPAGTKARRTEDHKGNVYPSIEIMCKAYNISPSTYRARRRRGWPLQKALEWKQSLKNKKMTEV